MSDEQLLREYLEAEIDEHRKAARYGTILFVILTVVIFGYFRWLRGALEEVIQPNNLSRTAVILVEENVGPAADALEESIRGALPNVMRHTVNLVVDKSFPKLTDHARGFLEEHGKALAEFASFTGHEIFVRVLREKRDAIKRVKPGEGLPEDRHTLVADLEASMKISLDRELTIKMSEEVNDPGDHESAAVKLHKSAQSLRNINAKLIALADSDNSERGDVVNKRIIGAWWSWLRASKRRNASEPEPQDREYGDTLEERRGAFEFEGEKSTMDKSAEREAQDD